MPRKSKRQSRKVVRQNEFTPPPVTTSRPTSRPSDFNPDYSYVTKDLRRIALLAGTFVVILVGLSFFLR